MIKKKVNPFYKSTPWLKCRLVILKRDIYLCQPCYRNEKITTANTVHHIKPLEEYPELALDEDNLESICPTCHNKEHPERGNKQKHKKTERMRATVVKSTPNRVEY